MAAPIMPHRVLLVNRGNQQAVLTSQFPLLSKTTPTALQVNEVGSLFLRHTNPAQNVENAPDARFAFLRTENWLATIFPCPSSMTFESLWK